MINFFFLILAQDNKLFINKTNNAMDDTVSCEIDLSMLSTIVFNKNRQNFTNLVPLSSNMSNESFNEKSNTNKDDLVSEKKDKAQIRKQKTGITKASEDETDEDGSPYIKNSIDSKKS